MDYETYKPALKYAIITYELDEDIQVWNKTISHIFYGDTIEEIQLLIVTHRKTDTFFNGSFLGKFDDITLKNEIVGLI